MLNYEPEQINDPENAAQNFNIQGELDNLEEIIFSSFNIPFTGLTLIEEEKLLNQLEQIKNNIPDAFDAANKIIRQKEEILAKAEYMAEQIIQEAEVRAAQIKNQTGIVQQAEQEAYQIRQQLTQECELIQKQTLAEVDLIRQRTIAECQEMRQGADEYADKVLSHIEVQLEEMMRVVQNGRQQIYNNGVSR